MLKLSVRRKIILVVVALSVFILAVGAVASISTLQSTAGRGRYVKAHFQRFQTALEATGAGDLAAAMLVASDPEVVRALGPLPGAVLDDRPSKDDKAGRDEREGKEAAPDLESAKKTRRRDLGAALERLSGALAGSIDPELVCVLDREGEIVDGGVCKLPKAALNQSRLLLDVRDGVTVRSKVALIGATAYWIAGVAVRPAKGDASFGSVLVGRKLQTFFERYALGSGSSAVEKQYRVSLVHDGNVVASALAKDAWPALAVELARPERRTVKEGNEALPVLQLGDKTYDYYDEEVPGYSGTKAPEATLGTLVMIRTRDHKIDQVERQALELAAWFALAAGIAILVGWWLARQITRPLDRFISATRGLATGDADLTHRLEVSSDDELGRLAANLNQVFQHVSDLAARVQQAALRVGDSSERIGTSSRTMLDGAKVQAMKMENSTAAVTELSASIQQVAENAREASKMAHTSGAAAEDAIGRLGQIRKAVEQAATRISELGQSGKRIGSIVEVIRAISEQTTLLALNAAIEAAHAGEQGRGFAVVADEVSNLAKRVGRSAKDIEDLIGTIREQTGDAVSAMQVGTREVEEGSTLVTHTLDDLKKLITVVEDTATAVNEQATASDEIARNMDAVRTIAREVLSSSEQTVTEGEQLSQVALALDKSVKGFKVESSRRSDAGLKAMTSGSQPAKALPSSGS